MKGKVNIISKQSAIKALLRGYGYKATPSRIMLAELLERTGMPMSIQGIVREYAGEQTDPATVYRSLELFEKAGLVRQVDLRHGHAHYEWAEGRPHHHHLVCTLCGVTEEYDGCEFEDFSKRALMRSKQFARINEHSSELFGVCKKCVKPQ